MLRLFAIILILTALSSCGSKSPPIELEKAVSDSLPTLPDTWSSAIESVGDVKVGWIKQIGDPTLTELVAEAQQNNRNLQVAAANVERSWSLADQAGASLTPTVTLASESERVASPDGGSQVRRSAGLQANWELDVWGRIRSGNQAAISSAQSAQADYIFSQNSLAAAVARGYFLAIESNRQVAVTQMTLDALTEMNRIVVVLKESGMVTSQDVALSKSDLASVQSALVGAKGAQRNALRALEALLGRYPSAELNVRDTLPQVPPLPPAGLPSTLLERRPDIIAAERSVAASFNSLDRAKAAQMPRISLTGSVGGASSDLSGLLNPANLAWQLASSLVAPLIDGGLREAQVEQATAEQNQAIAHYGQTVLDAFGEVESSLDQNVVLRNRAVALREAADEAKRALRIARLQYEEGETDLLSVLTIQQRVFSADADLVRVERARLDEWVGLNLAIGGSWQQTP